MLNRDEQLVTHAAALRERIDMIPDAMWANIHGKATRMVLHRGVLSKTDVFGQNKGQKKGADRACSDRTLKGQAGTLRAVDDPQLHESLEALLVVFCRVHGVDRNHVHTIELIRVFGGQPRQRYHLDQGKPGKGFGNLNYFIFLSEHGSSTIAAVPGGWGFTSCEVEFGDVWQCHACIPHAGPGHPGLRSGPERVVLFVSVGPASSDAVVVYKETIPQWETAHPGLSYDAKP
jgi:hypothetical protein